MRYLKVKDRGVLGSLIMWEKPDYVFHFAEFVLFKYDLD